MAVVDIVPIPGDSSGQTMMSAHRQAGRLPPVAGRGQVVAGETPFSVQVAGYLATCTRYEGVLSPAHHPGEPGLYWRVLTLRAETQVGAPSFDWSKLNCHRLSLKYLTCRRSE